MRSVLLILIITCFISCKSDNNHSQDKIKVLVYSNTAYYRHPELPAINSFLVLLGHKYNIEMHVTEHWQDLRPERLKEYDVLLLNNANQLADVIPQKQRESVQQWFEEGHGIVGVHATLVMQQGWPWLMKLGGCDFNSDSLFLPATIHVDPAHKDHPAIKGLSPSFTYTADWTNHSESVTGKPGFKVLLRVDEKTYDPVRPYFKKHAGKPMGKDHPVVWTNEQGKGRFFYTELGHDVRSLNTPFGRQHLIEGIKWAAKNSQRKKNSPKKSHSH